MYLTSEIHEFVSLGTEQASISSVVIFGGKKFLVLGVFVVWMDLGAGDVVCQKDGKKKKCFVHLILH
jgi:hypothetical protein